MLLKVYEVLSRFVMRNPVIRPFVLYRLQVINLEVLKVRGFCRPQLSQASDPAGKLQSNWLSRALFYNSSTLPSPNHSPTRAS